MTTIYPPECPVFICEYYWGGPRRGLVEGLEPGELGIIFRWVNGNPYGCITDFDSIYTKALTPLTPAARAMLAIAKAIES